MLILFATFSLVSKLLETPVGMWWNVEIYAIADKCEEIHKNGKEAYSIHCSSTASARFDKTTLINETMKTYKKLIK